MPVVNCIFARPDAEVHRFLLAEPGLRDHVYRLPHPEGIETTSGEGLTVVRIPEAPEIGERDRAWMRDELQALGLAPALSRFSWLRDVLPAPELAHRLWTLSQRTGVALAWFYWFERGDDLYADAALVFDPAPPRPLRPWLSLSVSRPEQWRDVTTSRTGRWLYARHTFLMARDDESECFELDDGGKAHDWNGSPLHEAMQHLGLEATTQYFVPADQSRFDWERYRLREP